MKYGWLMLPLLMLVAGCPVTQSQDTPVSARQEKTPSGAGYWIYVPSYYSEEKTWPLVITLHGTHGWDSSTAQMKEWKALAEDKGFIVVAPAMSSVQGILPVNRTLWNQDLERDEKVILELLDEICGTYAVDPQAVLLTGFSAGGYPMWYTGLRHPERFNMLIARACNSSLDIFENIPLNETVRRLPIMIFWGKDDLQEIARQSWASVQWLSQHGFKRMAYDKIGGGHLRRPSQTYKYWMKYIPKQYRSAST